VSSTRYIISRHKHHNILSLGVYEFSCSLLRLGRLGPVLSHSLQIFYLFRETMYKYSDCFDQHVLG